MAKKRPTKKSRSTTSRKPAPAKRSRAKKSTPQRARAAATGAGRKSARPAAAPNPMRALAQRIIDLTVKHDDEGAFALYADTVESIEARNPPLVGMEAIKEKFRMWRGMVSDSSWQARTVAADGNTIVIEWTGRVTFAGGKQVDFHEVAIHEVQNGKIVRERFYYDPAALQP